MRRSRKIILITLLAIVVLAGSIGGVVLAQTENGDDSQPKAKYQALLDKVCAIYEQNTDTTIDAQELQKAFDQARIEMQDEALDKYLQSLVTEDKITQEQADQYKAWLKSKPEVPLPFGPGGRGGMKPFGGGFRGFGAFGGRFHHWCEPAPAE